ncbi:MAG TPA: 2-amino-4-hydroxy-6-hydroxymethyldihydropteridine diphosphokinase [Actinotalea sp.]|nr:2-amino-4-hydroxy-6-hydroxymethyldihydropteridine diphosphokinase [Actinotalea sp.]
MSEARTPGTDPARGAAPLPGPADAVDRIRIEGIAAYGYHGVLDAERRTGQTFVADVVLHVDTRRAAATDRLDLTVDYGGLAEQVAQVLAGDPADLIETVAERIAVVALVPEAVAAVEVVLHKPQAPITVPFTDVSVHIRRDRRHVPSLVAVQRPADLPVADEPDDRVEDAADALPEPLVPPVTLALPLAVPPAPPVARPGPIEGRPDPLDQLPAEPVDVVLALGSNLGGSQETLRTAVADLAAVHGLEITAIAPLARTGPVGGPDQPDYLNTVLLGRTVLSPRQLLAACQDVEAAHGRERGERWGARTLDVDLILYGTTLAVADDLELPHPRAHQRAFVLEPWAQVAPDAVLPGLGGGPVAALARTAPDRDGIRWLALDWWSPPPERG